VGKKMPIVRTVADMVNMFSAKTAPDRVGARYEASKEIALRRYTNNAMPYRTLVEKIKDLLSKLNVPPGKWGVHIAFGEILQKISITTRGAVPAAIVEGLKTAYVAKGADPSTLDQIVKLVIV
jgi:hypothetical protein